MSTSRKTLQIYWDHAKHYPKYLALIFGMPPFLQLGDDFIVPLLTSRIITQIAKLNGPIELNRFIKPLAIILVLELGINFLWRPYVKVLWKFEESVMRDLLHSTFNHLLEMSNRFYSNRFAGSLVSQANKFAGSFERLTDAIVWNVYKLILGFIFTFVILIRPAPLYVLVISIFTFIYVVVLLSVKRTERPYNKRWAVAESQRTGQLADSISNILAVKAFAQEPLEQKLFSIETAKVHGRSLETMQKVMRNEIFTTTSQRLINVSAILSALYLAAHLNIPVGTIYLALVYTLSLMRRLWDLNNTLRALNRVFGDATEMTEIMDIKPEITDNPQPIEFKPSRGDIIMRKVNFAYDEHRHELLFRDFNVHIKPGEKVGLIGRSGSGKTTLTKLMLRFMDIQSGEILIDQQNIALVRQSDLRKAIAYVPQEPLMFHRTIADNIRYGQVDADIKEIEAVAKLANAHEFIAKLPKGYETLVGERGTKLSGGQKQRLAIARAMLKNAPILLLDEATSALDSESEALVQDALWKLMEGRTAIVIAHRLSTIQRMDRILVMENGKILEQGTHKELVKQKGIYAEMWNRQSGGFLDE